MVPQRRAVPLLARLGIMLVLAPAIFASSMVTVLEDESAASPYVPISKPDGQVVLSTMAGSLDECKVKCSKMIECKGVKFSKGSGESACKLLGAPGSKSQEASTSGAPGSKSQKASKKQEQPKKKQPQPARNGIRAMKLVADAKQKDVAKKAAQKVAKTVAKTQSLKQETAALKAAAAAPPPENRETVITIPAKKNPLKAATLGVMLDQVEAVKEQQDEAAVLEKQIKKDKKKARQPLKVPKGVMVDQLLSEERKKYMCKFAKTLHKTYIKRVETEVEIDAKKSPGNIQQKVDAEVHKMNAIIKRRAKREADTKMHLDGGSIKRTFLALLKEEDGQKKGQVFLKKLKGEACKIAKVQVQEVPKIKHVDIWKNCETMTSSCTSSAEEAEKLKATLKGEEKKKKAKKEAKKTKKEAKKEAKKEVAKLVVKPAVKKA